MSIPEFRRALLASLPTAVLVCALAGTAWWGHHNGWKMPAFAELLGDKDPTKDDWCEAHCVPEADCVECNPTKFARPKQYAFCEVHGVHQCPLEHPDIAQLSSQPQIIRADLDRAERALRFKNWPENNPTCNKLKRLVQFASEAILNKMGVEVMPVLEKPMVETVSASAEFTFEQQRVAPLYTVVSGRVWQVMAAGTLGTAVKKGDVLALVDAADVGKAKAEFLQAFAQVDSRQTALARLRDLQGQGAASEASLRQAEAALREASIRYLAAQQSLINLGLPIRTEDVKDLTPEQLANRIHFLGLPPA